jgi:hypothetical protein
MASEYDKTQAYKNGLHNKPARSFFSLRLPDREEVRQNERGKRDRALINEKKNNKK